MLTPTRLWRRLRSLLWSSREREELDEELRIHVEMEVERLRKTGVSAAEARRTAAQVFGRVPEIRDAARAARGVRAVEDLLLDLRVGVRSLARQRTFAAVAILTLAIGIGGTTALGSAVYRVLFAPYPYADAERLVVLWQTDLQTPGSEQAVSAGNFVDWSERARSFDLMAAAEPFSFDWVGPDGPQRFETTLVTRDFFTLQGLRPVLGRAFLAEEFAAGQAQVMVLSEALWRGRFGADSAIVGRVLVMDSIPRVVVGVMPHDAMAPFGAQIWAPKIFRPEERTSRTSGYWQVIARLAPGISLAQAQTELSYVAGQLAEEYPTTNRSTGAAVEPLRDAVAGSARQSLLVLFGAVACVLLIACVNVANLQMGETVRRRREFAIRAAIGAGSGRLVRQVLTESLLVAVIGSGAGLLVAYWGIAAIRGFAPSDLWQLERLALDGASLWLALVLALLSAVAIAVAPVVAALRIPLARSLSAGTRAVTGAFSGRRANRVLVVSEMALALVLLVGAGLLFRSLGELGRRDRGFEVDGVLITTLQAWGYYPTSADRAEFVRQAVDRIGALPGVAAVGVTSSLPLTWPIGFERARVAFEGVELAPGDEQRTERVIATTPGYFDALGIRVRRGRALLATDQGGAAPVALINEALARIYFPGADPIGKRVTFGFMGPPVAREIVGVVSDVRHEGPQADVTPAIFVPHAQAPTGALHFVVRAVADPGGVARGLRAELLALNGAMPLEDATTMEALVARSLQDRRFQLGLLASFSVTALLLAAIGIYGVMSRATTERTHEIGVRLAIGARPDEVRWLVLRSGGMLGLAGVVSGTVIALLLTQLMQRMLFGVTPTDPLTYVGAGGVLLVAALLASWVPAWRASTVDPATALRSD
jgi:putative ABC transport system permease protein